MRVVYSTVSLVLAIVAAMTSPLLAQQPAARQPHIGYVYTAGGQQGTRF
jgi:hypothetical protein